MFLIQIFARLRKMNYLCARNQIKGAYDTYETTKDIQ